MEDKIYHYMEEHRMLSPGSSCIAGVSGGADSVCLLLVLKRLSEKMDFSLYAVHINHMLRGEAANRDEAFVRALCGRYQVPCHFFHEDVKALAKEWKMTVEEAGRAVRYRCFEEVANQIEQDTGTVCRIAVAHNQDDQAETVVMNLLRGTGMAGASGMPSVRGRIIRPLLCVDRNRIEHYLERQGQPFCTDESNFELEYTRNQIRHDILPHMKEINQRAVSHLCSFAELSEQYLKYVDTQADEWLVKNCGNYGQNASGYSICIDAVKKADNLIENLVLKKLIGLCCDGEKDIGSSHILEVKKLYSSTTGSVIMLPHGAQVIRQYGKLYFYRKEDIPAEAAQIDPVIVKDAGIYPLLGTDMVLGVSFCRPPFNRDLIKKEYTKFIDYDKIRNDICVRSYTEDDYMVIDSAGSVKKMNRLFSIYKIPKEQRKGIPLLASGREIIWAVGMRIGENFKVDEHTKRIVCFEISVRKEEEKE